MPKYIFVNSGETARFDPKMVVDEIAGLGTKDVETCAVAIFVGKESNRISLTHFHCLSNPAALNKEAEWVGSPFKIILFKNQSEVKKTEQEYKENSISLPYLGDTEKNLIGHLKSLKWFKHIDKRLDSSSGYITVSITGDISSWPAKEKETKSPWDNLQSAINEINGIWRESIYVDPALVYGDGKFFLSPHLNTRALSILSMAKYRMDHMKLDITCDNILDTLKYIDDTLKGQGCKNGALDEIYDKPQLLDLYTKHIKLIFEKNIMEEFFLGDDIKKALVADFEASPKLKK